MSDFDIKSELTKLAKGRRPITGPARKRKKPASEKKNCPLCRNIKVFSNKNGVFPLCIYCWEKQGKPNRKAAKKLADEADKKHKQINEPNPWGL